MSEQTMGSAFEPVRKSVTVRSPIDAAFRLFTEGMGTWWPLEDYSMAVDEERDATVLRLVFEPKLGGRIYEEASDGVGGDWATVLAWEPPARVVLAWKPNRNENPPTEIEVRFTDEGNGVTRVDLEHRGWERLGEDATRARAQYAGGWDTTLGRFVTAAGAP